MPLTGSVYTSRHATLSSFYVQYDPTPAPEFKPLPRSERVSRLPAACVSIRVDARGVIAAGMPAGKAPCVARAAGLLPISTTNELYPVYAMLSRKR